MIGVIGSEKHIYKIPNGEIQIEFPKVSEGCKLMTEEELDSKYMYFRCPYRKYHSGEFKPCLERTCMAFRANNKEFWCALMEPKRGDKTALHPIEMLHDVGDDW